MKTVSILSALFLVVLLSGCNKNSELTGDSSFKLNDTLQLPINKSAINNENQILVRIDSVLNDSRCPSDVDCFWAGEATVRFLFTNADRQASLVLKIFGDSTPGSDTIIEGYRIQFVNLKPYPVSTKEISNDEYIAELLIMKN